MYKNINHILDPSAGKGNILESFEDKKTYNQNLGIKMIETKI